MRVRNWNPNKYDEKFIGIGMDRLREAAEAVADEIRNRCPVGTVSWPMYKTGPYANQPWTSRDAGRLKKSIRVVEKKESWGFEVEKRKNLRIYVGHYLAWYAAIVEFYTPFVRPAWRTALPKVKTITGAK